jgi:quercetin dioxygenase-like cupin family protein
MVFYFSRPISCKIQVSSGFNCQSNDYRKKTGTITIFAFDKGQGLSEHTAPFDAVVYVLDGEVEIVISGEALRATSGQMVIMPANEPHSLNSITSFKMLLVMIRS